jgi:ubiquinone/menaquinone biosynthesis C-methylase UbiE
MPKTGPFDLYSESYDQWFEDNRELYLAELEAVRKLMPSTKGQGLEVGVGTGRFAAPLGVEIGVEPSHQMAIRARKRGIRVCAAVAEELPFASYRFDFVLMITTICFLDHVADAFGEAYRVLQTGGCMIVAFVDKESKLGRQYAANRGKSKFYKAATFFSARQVVKHIRKAGFTAAGYKQCLIPGEPSGSIQDGFGQGGFVVIRGVKKGIGGGEPSGAGVGRR